MAFYRCVGGNLPDLPVTVSNSGAINFGGAQSTNYVSCSTTCNAAATIPTAPFIAMGYNRYIIDGTEYNLSSTTSITVSVSGGAGVLGGTDRSKSWAAAGKTVYIVRR